MFTEGLSVAIISFSAHCVLPQVLLMTCVRSGLAAVLAYVAVHVLGVVVRGIEGAAVLSPVRVGFAGGFDF